MLELAAQDENSSSVVPIITQFVQSACLLIERLLDYRYVMSTS